MSKNNYINEFIDKYHLEDYVESNEDSFTVINLKTSDKYSKVFGSVMLDSYMDISSTSTVDDSVSVFTDGYIEIKFSADFTKDIYLIELSER